MTLNRRENDGPEATLTPGGARGLEESIESVIELDSHEEAMQLFGPGDCHLRLLREAFGAQLTGRGCAVKLAGEKKAVEGVADILRDMVSRIRSGAGLPPDFVERAVEKHRRREWPYGADGEVGSDREASVTRPAGREGTHVVTPEEQALIRNVARSEGQLRYLRALLEKNLVFCIGPAGTGKTFLAVSMAIHLLREGSVKKIILCRPAVEAGEKLGFLPGDFQAKINPYLRPLHDALNDLLDYDQIKRYLEREIIEILPLAYMRGRTLNNAFIILDEGQNTTVSQMKMFLTRMGMDSRIVVNGDVTQVDLPAGQLSGLLHARKIIRGIPGIAWISLEKTDIVRHPLVKRIVEAYEKADARSSGGR